ncbi:GH25 family lysozyme [Rhodococcus sp. NPDC019627]|uniref:GH25 family lysozyme n=1 Tax=unclassified Rhodococcus (in: high G+C Gram-positive bacteria) TaxID=192944 RepID=UPI0033E87D03
MAAKFWPLQRGHVVTSGFGARWGTTHWGVDFGRNGGSGGLPVYAVQSGTVVMVGPASGFGQWVVLDHPTEAGGGTTVYGHIIPEVGLNQRVVAGQRIARINPDSSLNGGVDPHLHLEWHRYVWSQPGVNRLDPLPMLEGAQFPGEPVAADPAPVGDGRMTFFGIDIASWQAGLDMSRVKAEGFSYVIAKATEGADYTNPRYWEQRDGARANGLLFGAYHYVKAADSARAQVDRYESVEPDRKIPVMLDHELTSGNAGVLWAVHNEFVARGYRVNLIYLPRWYWSGHIGSPNLSGLPPLMSSNYGNERAGNPKAIYPGDGDVGWNGYAGLDVAIFQYSQKGAVAGYALDVNAFRGTAAELAGLFGSEEDDLPYSRDDLKSIIFECLETFVGPIGSDVKDVRFELTGGRNAGEYPGHPSLLDVRDGKSGDQVFHGTVTRFIQEQDAKLEKLTREFNTLTAQVAEVVKAGK